MNVSDHQRRASKLIIALMVLLAIFALPLPALAGPSDAGIKGSIRAKFINSGLQPFVRNLQIIVVDGKVRITGQVANDEERNLAQQLVNETPGVLAIENQLDVSNSLSEEAGGLVPDSLGNEVEAVENLASSVVFIIALVILVGIALATLFFVILWRRKRREDELAYRNHAGESEVKTYYRPEDYQRSIDRRGRQ